MNISLKKKCLIKNICVLKMKDMRVSESEQIIKELKFLGEGEK